jgi:hypothetical protein
VSSGEQAKSPWHKVLMAIAKPMIANVGGLAAGVVLGPGATPFATTTMTQLLNVMLDNQDAQLEQLDAIKADTQALVHGPYNTGMNWLREAASTDISNEDQRKFIENAIDKFMDAQGQEHEEFRKAQVGYQLGNCWTLLGKPERARVHFQFAHASAMRYLRHQEHLVSHERERYVSFVQQALPDSKIKWAGFAVVSAISPVGASPILGAAAIKKSRAYIKAKREFMEDAPTVLAFIDALEQLRAQVPELGIDFDDRPPTLAALQEALSI